MMRQRKPNVQNAKLFCTTEVPMLMLAASLRQCFMMLPTLLMATGLHVLHSAAV